MWLWLSLSQQTDGSLLSLPIGSALRGSATEKSERELVRVCFCCGGLNVERLRVSAALRRLDHDGTAVQCGLFLFVFLQAFERVMGLHRSSSLVSCSPDWTTHWTLCYQCVILS